MIHRNLEHPWKMNCPHSCRFTTYQIHQRRDIVRWDYHPNYTEIGFFYEDTNVAISSEYVLYDFNAIVTSVGGSLGLFLGFSCWQFICKLIDVFDRKMKLLRL